MPWRQLGRSLGVPAGCLVLNLAVFLWSRTPPHAGSIDWQRTGTCALMVSIACASAVVALPVGVWLLLVGARWGQAGRVDAYRACRLSYHLANELAAFLGTVTWTACLTTAGLLGRAPPFVLVGLLAASVLVFVRLGGRLTIALAMGLSFILWNVFGDAAAFEDLAPPLWVLLVLASGAARALSISSLAGATRDDEAQVTLAGQALSSDQAPTFRAFLETICRPLAVPPPAHLVVGLAPGISFFNCDVIVDGDTLPGGALHLSLPLSRILDRAELAGLVGFELVSAALHPPAWTRFITGARARAAHFLDHRLPGRIPRAMIAASYVPLELWTSIWSGLDVAFWTHAVQRAGVVAGRERAAVAFSKAVLTAPAWDEFSTALFHEIETSGGEYRGDENLSRRLAARLLNPESQPDLVAPLASTEKLASEYPAVAAVLAALGVDAADIAPRLRAAPADPAIDCVDGSEKAEIELSARVLGELRAQAAARLEAFPYATKPTPGPAPTGGATLAAPTRAPYLDKVTNPNVRPDAARDGMFTLPGRDRSLEGPIIAVVGILFVVGMVWMAGEPLIHRLFPAWATTSNGPNGFPVTVRVAEDDLSFTNRSATPWTCQAEVGYRSTGIYTVAFNVGPSETKKLSYLEFRGEGVGTDPERVRAKAHERGTLRCVEPSGISHDWGW